MEESLNELRRRFEREAVPLLGRLLRVALKFTGNLSQAEDLVQDTYVKAIAKFSQFRPGTNLFAWMSRIAYTLFINDYHRGAAHPSESLSVALDTPAGAAGQEDWHATEKMGLALLAARTREVVDEHMARALETLSPELRHTLVLCVVGGLRYAEAALVMRVPEGTVMSRLSRAKAAMRDELLRRIPGAGLRLPLNSVAEPGSRS